jgi:hypothetical protein
VRLDFHYYTIYALARAVGFNPDKAYVLAYASQYTDDEVNENNILFENGGAFEPFITAHRIFDLHTVTEEICKRVWMPFHFLPGNLGTGEEKFLTRPNGMIAQEMVAQFLSYDLLPYSLHLLGIILHSCADTWSHQSFMGLLSDLNAVADLRVNGEVVWEYRLAPRLGHAQTGSTPDDPSCEWGYLDYQGEPRHNIFNYNRARDAAHNCYLILSRFMDKFADDFRAAATIPWQQLEEKIIDLFRYQATEQSAITAWGQAISGGDFGFNPSGRDLNPIYDKREWFDTAIKSESKMNPESGRFEDYYFRNDNYESSDLKYFNEAAAFYWSTLFAENDHVRAFGLYA